VTRGFVRQRLFVTYAAKVRIEPGLPDFRGAAKVRLQETAQATTSRRHVRTLAGLTDRLDRCAQFGEHGRYGVSLGERRFVPAAST
jgi:hypothetical protein